MLAPWKESYDNPRQSIKKLRHHFANKGPHSQSYGFSGSHAWMWELDHKKKAEHWRIDAFELWCWRRVLRVPWTARRSNQSVLKEINPEYSLEELMLKMKLQLWPPDVKRWLIERDLGSGKTEDKRRRGWQGMRCLDGNTDSMHMSLRKLREMMEREPWGAAVHRVAKSQST